MLDAVREQAVDHHDAMHVDEAEGPQPDTCPFCAEDADDRMAEG